MAFCKDVYKKEYAPNTRETFRCQVLHQFVQARIAEYNPDNPILLVLLSNLMKVVRALPLYRDKIKFCLLSMLLS